MSDLETLLLDLLALPCVTGEEGPIADWLEHRYASERIRRAGHSLVVGGEGDGRPVVLLVGHIDVVPPTPDDLQPRREGERIIGRGSSDMKSGLAVAMDCFEDPVLRSGPYDIVLVAYAGEEGAHESNELGPVLDAMPDLRSAVLAVVLEPTDLDVHLGCMGTLHAEVTVRGRAAHSARPWQGENALTKAGAFLTKLHERPPQDVTVDGLGYREVISATQGRTSNARNVIPDAFVLNLNYRFAPDKTLDEAVARLRAVVGTVGEVVVTDRAPAGRPSRGDQYVEAFLASVAAPVAPKQAWTDVARLSAVGIPALNYGPGVTAQAHQAGEYVPAANLPVARGALAAFLGAPAPGGEQPPTSRIRHA